MSQIKSEGLPKVVSSTEEGEELHLLGVPNLGTVWTVEFLVVTFKVIKSTGNAIAKTEGIWRFSVQLLENEIPVNELISREYPSAKEGGTKEYHSGPLGFNIAQPIAIPGGQTLAIKVKTESVGASAGVSLVLEQGSITTGYTIHAKR